MNKLFKFYRKVLDGETVSIEADSLTEAVEILNSGDWEAKVESLETWGWEDVDVFDEDANLTTEHFPGTNQRSWRERACEACDGLNLRADVPPGALADVVTAARAALQACRTELEVRGADNDPVYAYPMAPVVRGLEEALENLGPVSWLETLVKLGRVSPQDTTPI